MSQLICQFSGFQACFLIFAKRDSVHRHSTFRNLGPFLLIFVMCRNRICTCKTQYKTNFFCFVFWLTQKRLKTEGLSFMHRHRGKSLFYVHARNGGPFSTVFYNSKCTSKKTQQNITTNNRGRFWPTVQWFWPLFGRQCHRHVKMLLSPTRHKHFYNKT